MRILMGGTSRGARLKSRAVVPLPGSDKSWNHAFHTGFKDSESGHPAHSRKEQCEN